MANPNSTNPVHDLVYANGFGDLSGKGVSIVCVPTNITTAVDVFAGTGLTQQFAGVVRGVFLIAQGGLAANITITNDSLTVATIAKGSTSGALVGSSGALANTTIARGGTFGIVSSGAVAVEADAYVFIAYSVTAT